MCTVTGGVIGDTSDSCPLLGCSWCCSLRKSEHPTGFQDAESKVKCQHQAVIAGFTGWNIRCITHLLYLHRENAMIERRDKQQENWWKETVFKHDREYTCDKKTIMLADIVADTALDVCKGIFISLNWALFFLYACVHTSSHMQCWKATAVLIHSSRTKAIFITGIWAVLTEI